MKKIIFSMLMACFALGVQAQIRIVKSPCRVVVVSHRAPVIVAPRRAVMRRAVVVRPVIVARPLRPTRVVIVR